MKLDTEIKTTITTNDYSIIISDKKATFNNLNTNIKTNELTAEKLSTGILIYDLLYFNGFRFLDKDNNFYDTVTKRIYFKNGKTFIGDKDKKAFSLLENYDEIENKITNTINDMKKEYKDEDKKKLANEMNNELKKEIKKFNFDKIKLINGKFGKLETVEGKKEIKLVNDSYKY